LQIGQQQRETFGFWRKRQVKRKRTEITIEIDEVAFVVGPGIRARAWCEHCHTTVAIVNEEEAIALTGSDLSTIRSWLADELIHYCETKTGSNLLCANSLPLGRGPTPDQ
jgi:hypothetical protein